MKETNIIAIEEMGGPLQDALDRRFPRLPEDQRADGRICGALSPSGFRSTGAVMKSLNNCEPRWNAALPGGFSILFG
ncbi:MAG: hypothetical protein U5J82_06525 [Desulfobacterales bacterium]|nr:hypothetical protein [Desulfobacterales bacterium]